jgi:hypothetical protein
MNQEAFIEWALDDARTLEERFTVEILVEEMLPQWHFKHNSGQFEGWEVRHERDRQRYLNPAYVPGYSETDLRRAAEVWPERKFWWVHIPHQKRPIRDVSALRFFTHLEEIKIHGSEIADPSPLVELPNLRTLEFASSTCEDFRPFARCTQLRSLALGLQVHWPELAGLDNLEQLETLSLKGNLIALPQGLVWPRVRRGTLNCSPLAVRSVRDLPRFPACEFLQLGGVERLEGIEAFPKLRNLTLTGVVRDFSPLTVLNKLTCFTHNGALPLDVTPLTRLPKLHFAAFATQHVYNIDKARPRDYMPLLDAPQLRELVVAGCPPVDAEVANLNTLFPTWDELFLVPQPRPVPPLRFIIAPMQKHPHLPDVALKPEDDGLADDGLRACEGRWVEKFIHRHVTAKLGGQPEWGTVTANGISRSFFATITCFALIEKLPLIVDGLREAIARLRSDYAGGFMVALKSPTVEPTPAQIELEKQFMEQQDKEEYERYHREHQEYLDRLYRLDLKKQSGEKINPDDFAVPPPEPLSPPPWEREDEDADDNEASVGGVAVKEKPDPPPSWLDDGHPLEDQYRMIGHINLSEIWIINYARDIASYLLGRQPDHEIPEEPK